jgi:hypothetical protein
MPQTTHAIEMPVARAGLMADLALVRDKISKLAEDAAGAHAGTFVVPGTDAENQAVVPTTAGEVTDGDGWGVVLYDDNEFDVEAMLLIMSKGRVWVLCDPGATVVANTPAFVRFAAGAGGSKLGAFREDADTATAAALPNGVFRSSHRDVDFDLFTQRIALVEIMLPTA